MAKATKNLRHGKRKVKGEPWVWLSGGAVATGIIMIVGMILLIMVEGTVAFWPNDIEAFVLGSPRYYVEHEEKGQAWITRDDDKIVFNANDAYRSLADKPFNGDSAELRKVKLTDYEAGPGVFDSADVDWLIRDAEGEVVTYQGTQVTPQMYVQNAMRYLLDMGQDDREFFYSITADNLGRDATITAEQKEKLFGKLHLEHPQHGQLFIGDGNTLYVQVKWRYADGTPVELEGVEVRKATIADYREFRGLFKDKGPWIISDPQGGPVYDSEDNPVTPKVYIEKPEEYPSPWGYYKEDGSRETIATLLGDDRWRDYNLLVGTTRGQRNMDIRQLPPNPDGTPVKSYQLDEEPVEHMVRQGNQGEGLYGGSRYFRWVREDLPDIDAARRLKPPTYHETILTRAPMPGAILIERLEGGVLTGYVTAVSIQYHALLLKGDEEGEWKTLDGKVFRPGPGGASPATVYNYRETPEAFERYEDAALIVRDFEGNPVRHDGKVLSPVGFIKNMKEFDPDPESENEVWLSQYVVTQADGTEVFFAQGGEVLVDMATDGREAVWNVFVEEQEKMRAAFLERYDIEKDKLGYVQFELKDLEDTLQEIRYEYDESRNVITAMESLKTVFDTWGGKEPLDNEYETTKAYAEAREEWLSRFEPLLDEWQKQIEKDGFSEDELEVLQEAREIQAERARIRAEDFARLRYEVNRMRADEANHTYTFETPDGKSAELALAHIVRAFQPNEKGLGGKLGVYSSRVWEFLTDDPREANTEGGIWPVIIGTLIMVLLMTFAVVPFGVIAALYLREYAKQGAMVSAVRIAVNNLAGVPSIVFGIFGLGFFCVMVGGSIDDIFYPELLPAPTFGGGGILWAALTLALLTVPVVIVSTEEALSAVPSSQREASLACGASKFQTVWKVVLPQALPGVLTGTILAMARGAGEVAPLMLVGAVKYAPYPPVDSIPPFVHLERKFMHLGFHIYDVGFQSPNVDNTKPLVFATALVLIALVAILNVFAISLRNRLRKKFATSSV